MGKYDRIIGDMMEDNIPVYYYEDKPYRVLYEGKIKSMSLFKKLDRSIADEPLTIEELEKLGKEFEQKGVKWVDIVVYEPLYEECDIRICVKEKEDFYNNYKPKSDESIS